tara:strand:- start:1574 stop:3433 length:1860 start_codon:yes stop_codon:yes gene_type:complete
MCGISGIFYYRNKVNVSSHDLQNLSGKISHRGPDSNGVWIKGNIGLAHNRLSIFDLTKKGNQPMFSHSKKSIISFNGEIYNWIELRETLPKVKWKSKTDTEVLLELYEFYGLNFIEKINGIFSFAIYDVEKKKLIIFRDRLGVKPLYFYKDNNKFIFASEIKSLINNLVEKKINYSAIQNFLIHGLIDHSNETFFKNIYKLKPGHFCSINKNGLVIKKYWDVVKEVKSQKFFFKKKVDYIEKYKELFDDSIKLQSRADVQIGTALSSGVDSSLISSYLKNKLSNFETFTYGFSDKGEIDAVKKISKFLQIKNHFVSITPKKLINLFDEVIYSQEAPITSCRIIAMHQMYKVVKKRGIKVMLEGQGGDEIAAGYEYYYAPYFLDELMKSDYTSAKNKLLKLMSNYKNINKNNFADKLLNSLIAVFKPGVSTQDGIPFVNHDVFHKDFKNLRKAYKINYPFKSFLKSLQLIDSEKIVLPRGLRYLDKASMNSSIEARVPYLDHRIYELSFSMPEDIKITSNQQKAYLFSSLKVDRDQKILKRINQSKKTIVDPQKIWLRKDLKNWVTDLFEDDSIYKDYNIFDKKKLIREYKIFCDNKKAETSFHIFQYINVILWLKVFFK